MLERISDAWAILTGNFTRQDVIRHAHHLGMHKEETPNECDLCFYAARKSYIEVCTKIMRRLGCSEFEIQDMDNRVHELTSDEFEGRWALFHEHPAYFVAECLGYFDHESEESQRVVQAFIALDKAETQVSRSEKTERSPKLISLSDTLPFRTR